MINHQNKIQGPVIKTLAVIGAIVLLSVGGFITITVLTKIPSVFAGITAQVVSITQRFIPAGNIVVTLSETNPVSNDLVRLSFDHQNKEEDGSYSFFYECREGVHLERPNTNEIIFCNTPYSFVNSDDSFSFKVLSTKNEPVDVPLSVNFVKNNSTRISERGEAQISINGGSSTGNIVIVGNNTGTTTGNIGTGTGTGTGNTNNGVAIKPGNKTEEEILFNETNGTTNGFSNPSGLPDLKSVIIAVGEIDRQTNIFTATNTIPMISRGAVKFQIENVGTKQTGSWYFNVVVPTFPSYIYHSTAQPSLFPGEKIEYVIGFDSIRNDGAENTIVVNADPISSVKEISETNNIVKSVLSAYIQ